MNKEQYKSLLKKKSVKEPRFLNALLAFGMGGLMGVFSEALINLYMILFGYSRVDSAGLTCLTVIFLASLCTALGFFDNLVAKFKCGLSVPTTGFAHSVTSAALEYRREGLITGIGSNFFKLAGSVILYGIISSFFLCLLGVVIYG